MILMQIIGFFCALLIGLSLGLMGGGGSLLTIPVLVYLLGVNPILSTVYSLFIVGTTSFIGSLNYIRKQQVHCRVALLFSLPSFGAIFLIRRYVIPAIPDPISLTVSIRFNRAFAFMLFFAFVMLLASVFMLTDRRTQPNTALGQSNYLLIVLAGLLVGSLTGLAGIGGGFLITPALVLLVQLPMKRAIGTSLLIITANSLVGFLADTILERIDWPFLLVFTALAVLGILVGSYLSQFISGLKLRKVFGWSVLVLSLYIIGKEALIPILVASLLGQP